MQNLHATCNQIILLENNDKWSYVWGSTYFSSVRVYKELGGAPNSAPGIQLALEEPLLAQTQSFLLATTQRQA